jgi:hypothetical protein
MATGCFAFSHRTAYILGDAAGLPPFFSMAAQMARMATMRPARAIQVAPAPIYAKRITRIPKTTLTHCFHIVVIIGRFIFGLSFIIAICGLRPG